jgi:hypothetical protein
VQGCDVRQGDRDVVHRGKAVGRFIAQAFDESWEVGGQAQFLAELGVKPGNRRFTVRPALAVVQGNPPVSVASQQHKRRLQAPPSPPLSKPRRHRAPDFGLPELPDRPPFQVLTTDGVNFTPLS